MLSLSLSLSLSACVCVCPCLFFSSLQYNHIISYHLVIHIYNHHLYLSKYIHNYIYKHNSNLGGTSFSFSFFDFVATSLLQWISTIG